MIVTRDDNVVGVVTDRDITVRAVADMLDPQRATLSQIVSSDLVTVSRQDDALTAADTMRAYRIRRLPVTDDGLLVGLVSIGDLAVEREPESVLADISADDPNR